MRKRERRKAFERIRKIKYLLKMVLIGLIMAGFILLSWQIVVKSSSWFKSIIIENPDYNLSKDSNSIHPYGKKKTQPK